ncbi:MAG: hypothetical protein GY730_09220 [bacterium]|nr:hypothetical protein [bacterium]
MNKIVSLKNSDFSNPFFKNECKKDIIVSGFINENIVEYRGKFPLELITQMIKYTGMLIDSITKQLNCHFQAWCSEFSEFNLADPSSKQVLDLTSIFKASCDFFVKKEELQFNFSLKYSNSYVTTSWYDEFLSKKIDRILSKYINNLDGNVNNFVRIYKNDLSMECSRTDSSLKLSAAILLEFTGNLMQRKSLDISVLLEQTKNILRLFGASTSYLNFVEQNFSGISEELKNNIEKHYGFTVLDIYLDYDNNVCFTFEEDEEQAKNSNSPSHMNNIKNQQVEIYYTCSLLQTFKIFAAICHNKPAFKDIDILRLHDKEYLDSISNNVNGDDSPFLYRDIDNKSTQCCLIQ